MTRKRAASVVLGALLLVLMGSAPASLAAGLNTATLFRYPWIDGETRVRTQGQFSVGDHNGNGLTYAVDWGLAAQSALLFAPNAGTATCHPQSKNDASQGFGRYISVYNSIGSVVSIIAHTVQGGGECFGLGPENPTSVLQGQFLGVGDNSGTSTGAHIHFQADAGDNETGVLNSIPFTMSDRAPNGSGISFPDIAACTNGTDTSQCVSDGPSDNAGVAYSSQNPVTIDASIASAYQGLGGSSGSWWNVGAAFQSDEHGGVCQNTTTAFVHVCGTNFGNGLLGVQNYIDWKGVRHSVYHSSSFVGHVKGQIQGALSNGYAGGSAVPCDGRTNDRRVRRHSVLRRGLHPAGQLRKPSRTSRGVVMSLRGSMCAHRRRALVGARDILSQRERRYEGEYPGSFCDRSARGRHDVPGVS